MFVMSAEWEEMRTAEPLTAVLASGINPHVALFAARANDVQGRPAPFAVFLAKII